MNADRPRLTTHQIDPALRVFLLKLSVDTIVNQYDFANWMIDNLDWLRAYFAISGEPSTDHRVENCQAVWLRLQFKQRTVTV